MASNIPERKEHPSEVHVTTMPLAAKRIDEDELKRLTPSPPSHNQVFPFLLPTPGFVENTMDQEQPPDSFWNIPTWQVFPNIYNIKRHSSVYSSATPKPYVSQFVPFVPSAVDLLVGHAIDSWLPLSAVGILGTLPGIYLRRSAPLSSKLISGAATGLLSASAFFPLFRFTQYRLGLRAIREEDLKSRNPPAIPMSARRSWIGMDEEGNVKQTFGYFEENPYQRWEDAGWQGRRRDIWERIYKKIDEEKLKEALHKREQREAAQTNKQNANHQEEHH